MFMKLEGYVEHIIYRNTENGYSVLNVISEDQEITAVGVFHYVDEGEFLELEGSYTEHPLYGEQFSVEQFEVKAPKDILAIERYLGSGAIKGIGAALAARIVRRFGKDTFEIMEREPERLSEIKGISERKAQEIAEQMEDKRDLREAMIFLQDYGISVNLSVKIYQKYRQEIYHIIKENPYRLADDITGIGFRTADEIAKKVGIREDSDFRIRSGILYVLLQASAEGHTCLPMELLLDRTVELLGVLHEPVEKHLMDLGIDRKVVQKVIPGLNGEETRFVYAATYYYAELGVAAMLCQLNLLIDTMESEVHTKLHRIEKQLSLELDEYQREAVVAAVRNGLLILTGGPGTGKTTTINAIIHYFEEEGLEILLAAPTGRAAKRMTEATGCESRTIHRMLELSGGPENLSGRATFARNEDNPLEADVIIIDETSMVDIHLIQALLKAIVPGTRLILVGDVNQLPSVGPGSVLQDIIESEAFPVVRLTKIFRQAAESDIIVNAHKIHRGEQVTLDNKSRDFFFLQRQDPNIILRVVLALVQEKMPKYVNAEISDIQVLTPMRKGVLGVENLNQILQRYLNPPSKDKEETEHHGQNILRTGDKVMQIRNNYQLEWEVRNRFGIAVDRGVGVFNGDMGIIRSINTFAEELTVEFDEGRMVSYPFKQLEELELAYAITVHKSQGSEYPAVVIPLLSGPKPLMNRNLLYTAVTRARSCVTLVGSPQAFQMMVENETEQKRYTGLSETIKSYLSSQMPDL
ncbi:MAG: ATP-dependent RecD-like DNA helicase [Lachnospiraceae bacterium]|nr:ATP-dependent RecD-like DNA helicase [Lachnospiraceae bacterium]